MKKKIDTHGGNRVKHKTPVLVSNESFLHPAARSNRKKKNQHKKKLAYFQNFFFTRFDKISEMVGEWST